MEEIKSKIYYDINNATILLIIGETTDIEMKTTKEQDMELYEQLKDKNINEVDFMELEYGTLATTFNNIKSY